MKAVLASARFPRELGGWAGRGGLCAALSCGWALLVGFNTFAEIAGMLAGVAVWVVGFAGFCTWHGLAPRRGPERLVAALKLAAWIKFASSAAGALIFALWSQVAQNTMMDFGVLAVLPDGLLGLVAMGSVAWLGGTTPNRLAGQDSFARTAGITLVDGVLFLGVIAALAGVVLAWWRVAPVVRWHLGFSPTRTPG